MCAHRRFEAKSGVYFRPPGAGKGTQCRKIVDRYGFVHISAGELLRQERQNNSKYSDLIEKCITEGRIVPAQITCKLLEKAIVGAPLKNRFLIDGYPRNFENRDEWDKSVGDKVSLLFVLYIDCSPEVCKVRCLNRGLPDLMTLTRSCKNESKRISGNTAYC